MRVLLSLVLCLAASSAHADEAIYNSLIAAIKSGKAMFVGVTRDPGMQFSYVGTAPGPTPGSHIVFFNISNFGRASGLYRANCHELEKQLLCQVFRDRAETYMLPR